MRFKEAMIVSRDDDGMHSPYENVEILENGWVKANAPTGGGRTVTTYFSPSEIERIYKP